MTHDTTPPTPPTSQNVAGNTYDKYAATNPIERRMMQGFLAAFDRSLDAVLDGEPGVILEVGAGEGHITRRLGERFPHARVIGLDLLDDTLAAEWAGSGLAMTFGDATQLPFADASVDLVVALEVLEHVTDPGRALAEIDRVARTAVVLSVPREPIWRAGNLLRRRYVGALGNTPGHVNHWSARSFRRFVDTTFDVAATSRPLPWTMVGARPR